MANLWWKKKQEPAEEWDNAYYGGESETPANETENNEYETYDNGEPANDISVLFISKTKNIYYTLASDGCDFKECVLDEELTETQDIGTIISDLKAKGYKELT